MNECLVSNNHRISINSGIQIRLIKDWGYWISRIQNAGYQSLSGISGDKFFGTKQNQNSREFNIPAPDIRLCGYPSQP